VPGEKAHDPGRHDLSMRNVILFYKYHPLSEDRLLTEAYRRALEEFCRSLNLIGRILVSLLGVDYRLVSSPSDPNNTGRLL
jgi:predicted sulfurtransferase